MTHFRHLILLVTCVGGVAAAHLRAAGGCAAGPAALAIYITCCVSGVKASVLLGKRTAVIAAIWNLPPECSFTPHKDAETAQAAQLTTMIELLTTDSSREALCKEVPDSLPAAATHVLTCARGTAALDAVWVATSIAELIGLAVGIMCQSSSPRMFKRMANLPMNVSALAASLICLACCPGVLQLAVCRPEQQLPPYASGSLIESRVRLTRHVSIACRWLQQQLPQDRLPACLRQNQAAALKCSGAASVALLAAAERWGRTNCWNEVPASHLRGGWPVLARDAAALLHTMAAQPAARQSAAMQALQDVNAAQALQQMVAWVAESPTIASTTGALAEALPALETVALADAEVSRQLAAKGGLHEWAPVADAFRRRLPRRMAARLLPMVESVASAIVERPANHHYDAAATADAAMAALLLVRAVIGSNFLSVARDN